jgi:hypothetical protein
VTLAAVLVGAAATLVVALAAWRARRRRAGRRAHRLASLEATAQRIDAAVASLRELDVVDRVEHAPVPPVSGAPSPAVAAGLPGRAALVEALSERVAEARADGSRIAAAVVRSGADDATALAQSVKAVVDAPVYAVGTRAVALLLPGLGRAEALGVLARIEATCRTTGRAVELEQGEDGVELLARLMAIGQPEG